MNTIANEPSRFLLLPGWQNSGAEHWQSHWEQQHGYLRVDQHDWTLPLRGDWVARLEEVVLVQSAARKPNPGGLVLVAHSLGCQLVAAWAAHSRNTALVGAAMLVAPGDPERDELRGILSSWSPIALQRLPFRSSLLVSQNDPYCEFDRARAFATGWGSEWVDCGHAGHINAESGLGSWPQGHAILLALTGDEQTTRGND